MGLDASVMCNCFALGLTTEPPVPREWLQIDDEGYLGLKSENDSDEAFHRLYEWEQTCCGHPGMKFAWESIANWTGYRLFQQALASVGWGHFPMLRHELPEANGGKTEAAMAALALGELDEFRKAGEVRSNVCLVDTATGDAIQEHVAAYGGIFILDGRSGVEGGIDGDGFFIRTAEDKLELFRSARFRQTLLDPDRYMSGPEPGRVVFHALDSGREFECRTAISGRMVPWPDGRMQDDKGRCNFEYPAEFHVEVRVERSSDFEYILVPLTRVFRASVETGNPVRWC